MTHDEVKKLLKKYNLKYSYIRDLSYHNLEYQDIVFGDIDCFGDAWYLKMYVPIYKETFNLIEVEKKIQEEIKNIKLYHIRNKKREMSKDFI